MALVLIKRYWHFWRRFSPRTFTVMSAAAPRLRTYTSLKLQSHHSLSFLLEGTLSSGEGFTAHLWYFSLECDFKSLWHGCQSFFFLITLMTPVPYSLWEILVNGQITVWCQRKYYIKGCRWQKWTLKNCKATNKFQTTSIERSRYASCHGSKTPQW